MCILTLSDHVSKKKWLVRKLEGESSGCALVVGFPGVGVEKASRLGQNTNANARALLTAVAPTGTFDRLTASRWVAKIPQSSAENRTTRAPTEHTCVGKTSHTLWTVQNFGERARGGRASTTSQVVVCSMVCVGDWTKSRAGRRPLPGAGGNPGRPCRKAVVRSNADTIWAEQQVHAQTQLMNGAGELHDVMHASARHTDRREDTRD